MESYKIFNGLSSGHKIVLLTITKLVEMVSEKTLVILDEPELHLHPPLLSSFIRSLSHLLIKGKWSCDFGYTLASNSSRGTKRLCL